MIRIANSDGSVAEALDYATFGARRAVGNPAGSGTSSTNTPRGFTGHEYVDGTDVIHMNGRIYDAKLGRFLQADPLIQAPTNGQSWNAYTYVFNNPLVYTDPTGNFSLRQTLGLIIAIVGTIFMPYLAPVFTKLGAAMLVGFVSGYVSTGTLQGGLFGAFSAAVFYGIGTKFQQIQAANGAEFKGVFGTGLTGDQFANKVLSHGVAGGVMSRLQGGKFGHGFLSAGVAELTSPMIDGVGGGAVRAAPARVAAAALVGGTVSVATGGKFGNGASQAAFSRLFNQEMHAFNAENLRRKNAITQRIDDFIEQYPGRKIPLSAAELGVLTEYTYGELMFNQSVEGNYDGMSNREFGNLMQGSRGDSQIFNGYNREVFSIYGMPGGYSGTHLGTDINYMMQGMSWAAGGYTRSTMHRAIEAWNTASFVQDVGGGNFTARNLLQISHAKYWADYGYSYYHSRAGK